MLKWQRACDYMALCICSTFWPCLSLMQLFHLYLLWHSETMKFSKYYLETLLEGSLEGMINLRSQSSSGTCTQKFWVHWQGFYNLFGQLGSVFKHTPLVEFFFLLFGTFLSATCECCLYSFSCAHLKRHWPFPMYFLHSHLLDNWKLRFYTSLTSLRLSRFSSLHFFPYVTWLCT